MTRSLQRILFVLPAALALLLAGPRFAGADDAKSEKIYFVSQDGADFMKLGIYVMNADGTGRAKISKGDAIALDPVLSPDGKHVAYSTFDPKSKKSDVHVMNADGSGSKQLTKVDEKQIAFAPCWSPDGKRIAYSVIEAPENGPPQTSQTHVMDADGGNKKKIADGMMPVWSPDGKKVLYTVLEVGKKFDPRLHLVDADGQNDKALLEGKAMMGVYSPDGKRIVYMGAKEGERDEPHIYVCKTDGSEAKALTAAEKAFELAPRWSADGKRVYFNRMDQQGNPPKAAIFVIDADGKNEKRLSKDDSFELLGGSPLILLTRGEARQQ